MTVLLIDQVLDFWFGTHDDPEYGHPKTFWFNSTPEIDQTIKDTFLSAYEKALAGELDDLMGSAEGCLTLVLILDQFPRNMFRGTGQAFASDKKALSISKHAIEKGFNNELTDFKCKFLYMPFMHSENLEDQNQGIELFRQIGESSGIDYAIMHRDIIARFGQFPHRNEILGRKSTPEEIEFLKGPNSSF